MNFQEYKEKVFAERPDVKREYEKLGERAVATNLQQCCSTVATLGEPLTIEQLRGMDGEPVWIMEYPDWGHWELSEDAGDYIADRDTGLYGLTYPDPEGRDGLHKLGWLAYRYPPIATDTDVGGKLDEWTAEWIKHDGYTECSKCEHWYDSPENEDDGDRPAFCPSCGRAMTPGARAMLEKRFMG